MSMLFSPISLGSVELKNRIVIPPMCQYSAHDGCVSDWHIMHFGAMTQSGAGLFIIEATAVEPRGRISYGDIGLWNDATEFALKEVLERVRTYSDMPVGIQLGHAGRKGSSELPWLNRRQLAPEEQGGWKTVSASAVSFDMSSQIPVEASLSDIKSILQAFKQAAERAVRAGINVIEIHGAHGYLLHQFLSPLSNKRTDLYGGSWENRTRLLLEVFDHIKEVIPKSVALGVRISATDWVDGGWDLEQSVRLAKILEQKGCDFIDVSSGGLSSEQKVILSPGYQVPFAEAVKKEVSMPVIAVGLITEAEQAEDILHAQEADAVAIGRSMLFNPRWPWQAALELKDKVAAAPQYWRGAPQNIPIFLS